MKKQLLRKLCGGLLSAAMILAAVPAYAPVHAASVPRDVRGHWAQKSIERAIDAGIVAGYKDGSFRPDAPVTRAEFCHMVNAALGNTATASINFRDVSGSQWYYSDVSKAVAAGFVSGYSDGTFKPDQRITRQEAAVMLARIVPVSGSKISLSSYPDYGNVDSWARNSLSCAAGKKYITTYADGRIHPKDNMTRGQASTIISNVLSRETIIKTTPTITKDAERLSNAIYSNGVTLGKGLDNGQATLTNCVVLGNLDVSGGVLVTLDGCRVASLMTRKTGDAVRVLAKGETSVHKTSATETATLDAGSVSSGSVFGNGFDTVNIARNANITLRGNFSTVNVEGSSSKTDLISGSIATLNVSSQAKGSDITIESNASVNQANVNAEVYFHGTGTISRMNANASGITYEKQPNSFGTGSDTTLPTNDKLSISISPSNGAKKVNLDTNIKITFNRAVLLANGDSAARSDIEKIVELRRKTESGTKVDYTASIDSAKKVITISPDSDLEEDTKYYVIIDKNEFKDTDGNKNTDFTASFTTGDETSELVSFTPKDKATGVSVSKNLTIRFSEPVTDYENGKLRDRDLSGIVILREKNSSGARVDFTASIDSEKVITIDPDENLDEDTKYYLAIKSKSLRTKSDKKAVEAQSITFTTTGSTVSDYCTFYPKNKATGVSTKVNPTLTFSEKMVRYDKKTISNNDLQDIVSLRNTTQNADVPFTASINSGKTVITIKPKSALPEGCKFEVRLKSKSIRTAKDYDTVPAASVTWTTTGTLFQTSLSVNANDDTITVSASGTKAGTIYAVLLKGSASTPSDAQIIAGKDASGSPALGQLSAAVTANTSKELGKFTDLSPNTSYKVCAVLKPTSGSNAAVASKTVNTSDRPASKLTSLSVLCGGKTISVPLSSKTDYTAKVPFGTTDVTVIAETSGGNTNISSSRDGSTGLNPGAVRLPLTLRGDEGQVTIVSNTSGRFDTTYTLTLKAEGDTSLSSVSVNGERLSASGSRYSYEIPADISSVDIEVSAADPNAFLDTDLGRRGTGSVRFSASGAQTIEITVDSNGDTKTYTLVLTKKSAPEPKPDPAPENPPQAEGGSTSGSAIS